MVGDELRLEHELESVLCWIEGRILAQGDDQLTHPQQPSGDDFDPGLLADLAHEGDVQGLAGDLAASGQDVPVGSLITRSAVAGGEEQPVANHDRLGGWTEPLRTGSDHRPFHRG